MTRIFRVTVEEITEEAPADITAATAPRIAPLLIEYADLKSKTVYARPPPTSAPEGPVEKD